VPRAELGPRPPTHKDGGPRSRCSVRSEASPTIGAVRTICIVIWAAHDGAVKVLSCGGGTGPARQPHARDSTVAARRRAMAPAKASAWGPQARANLQAGICGRGPWAERPHARRASPGRSSRSQVFTSPRGRRERSGGAQHARRRLASTSVGWPGETQVARDTTSLRDEVWKVTVK
jgi:hypothetical protein